MIMMKIKIVAVLLILGVVANAQKITCSPEDKSLFETKISDLEHAKASNLGDTIALVGQSFLGTNPGSWRYRNLGREFWRTGLYHLCGKRDGV